VKTVTVTGRFVYEDDTPIRGRIKFIPYRLWVEDGNEVAYPCMAPELELLDGRFEAELTRTDTGGYPWHYTVQCPLGEFKIKINKPGPLKLKDLITRKYA
jgi:hypothetical protein